MWQKKEMYNFLWFDDSQSKGDETVEELVVDVERYEWEKTLDMCVVKGKPVSVSARETFHYLTKEKGIEENNNYQSDWSD